MGGGHDMQVLRATHMCRAGMPNRVKTGSLVRSLRRGAVYRARGNVKGLSACKATGCKATG